MRRSSSVPPRLKMNNELIDKLFKNLPSSYSKDVLTVKEAVSGGEKQYYEYLSKNAPKFINVQRNKDDKRVKFQESLNTFQQVYYDYNVQRKNEMKNYIQLQKENNAFCGEYHKIEKKKACGLKNPYIINEAIVSIINEYAKNKVKIPDLSVEKNIFKENPLIVGDGDMESFFLFHRKPNLEKKAIAYLNKIGDTVQQKIQISGLDKLKRKKESIEKKSNLPEEKEIKQNEIEIQNTQNALDNIEGIDDFFKTRAKKFKLRTKEDSSRKVSIANKSAMLSSGREKYLSTVSSSKQLKPLTLRKKDENFTKRINNIKASPIQIVNKSVSQANIMRSTLEKLYHNVTNMDTAKKNINDIKAFLIKNKYNVENKDVSTKVAYSHVKHAKDTMLLKNFILEDYDIRRDRNIKIAFSPKQLAILAKNKKMEDNLNMCEGLLKRLVYEGKIDKESYSY